jgi:hypothetical protein
MDTNGQEHLPPLAELIPQVAFDVYGLGTPILDLQLRALHYGIAEKDARLVGMMLCYAQRFQGSPQVFSVESSLLPESVDPADPAARIRWSWINFLNLRECLHRLHADRPPEALSEEALEEQFEAGVRELSALAWVPLAPKSTRAPLAGMEVSRDRQGLFLARRFEGVHLLVVGSVGLSPDQFTQAVKSLLPLQSEPDVVERHQKEFEHLVQPD